MSTANTYVRARIDENTKARATEALESMGLSVTEAVRLLIVRVANEQRLPFGVVAPTETTRQAIDELEAGIVKRFDTVDDLMTDLHADD